MVDKDYATDLEFLHCASEILTPDGDCRVLPNLLHRLPDDAQPLRLRRASHVRLGALQRPDPGEHGCDPMLDLDHHTPLCQYLVQDAGYSPSFLLLGGVLDDLDRRRLVGLSPFSTPERFQLADQVLDRSRWLENYAASPTHGPGLDLEGPERFSKPLRAIGFRQMLNLGLAGENG